MPAGDLSVPAGRASSMSTPALVRALRILLVAGRVPGGADQGAWAVYAECLAELSARGIDADSLVRFGLTPEVVAPLIADIAIYRMFGRQPGRPPLSSEHVDEWIEVLGIVPAQSGGQLSPQDLADTVSSAAAPIFAWVFWAPLDSLYRLSPPTADQLQQILAEAPPAPELLADYRWVAERLGVDGLEDWSTGSLHREYRWYTGSARPPCASEVMAQRQVERSALNAEIARRAATHEPTRISPEQQSLAGQMYAMAIEFLRSGQYAEAAALFQFAVQQNPNDATARNDLGFCRMPTDAAAAIFNLEHAYRMGYQAPAVNFYNRIICHIALSQGRIALNLAEEYWVNHVESERMPVRATLWQRADGDSLILTEVLDARVKIAELGLELSITSSDRKMWEERRRHLTS